jgi:hypothetical protein
MNNKARPTVHAPIASKASPMPIADSARGISQPTQIASAAIKTASTRANHQITSASRWTALGPPSNRTSGRKALIGEGGSCALGCAPEAHVYGSGGHSRPAKTSTVLVEPATDRALIDVAFLRIDQDRMKAISFLSAEFLRIPIGDSVGSCSAASGRGRAGGNHIDAITRVHDRTRRRASNKTRCAKHGSQRPPLHFCHVPLLVAPLIACRDRPPASHPIWPDGKLPMVVTRPILPLPFPPPTMICSSRHTTGFGGGP